jgi:hypothetical protein
MVVSSRSHSPTQKRFAKSRPMSASAAGTMRNLCAAFQTRMSGRLQARVAAARAARHASGAGGTPSWRRQARAGALNRAQRVKLQARACTALANLGMVKQPYGGGTARSRTAFGPAAPVDFRRARSMAPVRRCSTSHTRERLRLRAQGSRSQLVRPRREWRCPPHADARTPHTGQRVRRWQLAACSAAARTVTAASGEA